MKPKFALAAALVALMPVAALAQRPAPAPAGCDRTCLIGVADAYVAGLVAHDPKIAPLGSALVTVENSRRIASGEGVWKTLSAGPTAFKIVVPDATSQQVAYLAVLQEDGKPIQLGLRLKVQGAKVVEAEHMVVRNLRDTSLNNLKTVRTNIPLPVPEPYRDSRGRLLTIAAAYYDALDNNNGSLGYFADDCVRRENGFQTARNPVPDDPIKNPFSLIGALGCAAQIDSGAFQYITTIGDRRVWIADEQTGLAVGFSHFYHAQTTKDYAITGIPWYPMHRVNNDAFDLPAMHIFKIWGGKVHEIEAIGFTAPYRSPTGWEK